jgi:hypothetical protein
MLRQQRLTIGFCPPRPPQINPDRVNITCPANITTPAPPGTTSAVVTYTPTVTVTGTSTPQSRVLDGIGLPRCGLG